MRKALALVFATLPPALAAQIHDPCAVITKVEAEAIVGGPLIGPEPSPQHTLCKYYEAGYGQSPGKIKLVTVGVWYDSRPDDEAVNTRRLAVTRDSSLLPLAVKELAGPGDAAIWVWAGNRLGALYAFKGGTTEVAVKISGTSREAALAAAKRFATRALGGAGRSTFAYAATQIPMDYKDYYAPRILSSLYLGTFAQLADDPMTRDYVLSLAQAFNGICPSVPDPVALLTYGYYWEVKGQKDMFKSAWQGNAAQMFRDVAGMLRRARPHMMEIAHEDAQEFITMQQDPSTDVLDPDPADCLTPQIEHLYENIAALTERRSRLPPDVEDDQGFLAELRPDAQKQLGFDPRAPRVVTPVLAMKRGCDAHTAGAAASGEATAMEVYCRCLVNAAVMGNLPDAEIRALGAHFDDRTLKDLGDRYPAFNTWKKDCYH
jgi:hypothetical protein